MNHTFFLVKQSETDFRKYLTAKSDINLHDDLLRYMIDTLYWIPSANFSGWKKKPSQGLSMWGSTIIEGEGLNILFKIMNAWINLFSCSPPKLKLTGPWTEHLDDEGNVEGEGYYSTLELDRDEIIKNLEKLADYAQKASNEGHYILHIGI
ncbi:MAG: hypothetical protein SAJ37_04480 [Oscillatoria sp. PMC 1068.18]|nr:hypothetical protein [Oscillatoria sp. PMC 1068.18]